MLTNHRRFSQFLRILRYTHALFGGAAALFLVFVILNTYVITLFRVHGNSMNPTLTNGQPLPVFIAARWFGDPGLGDIVIVQYNGSVPERFVKRVVAVPGDTVTYQGEQTLLGPGEYFVEGDNRDFSTDSRAYGPVTRDRIIGEVLGSYAEGPKTP